MQGGNVAVFKEFGLGVCGGPAIGPRAFSRSFAGPDDNVHAEGLAVFSDRRSDAAITHNAESFAAQRLAETVLPFPSLNRCHLLRNLAHRGQHQSPGGFSRGIRRRASVLV